MLILATLPNKYYLSTCLLCPPPPDRTYIEGKNSVLLIGASSAPITQLGAP